MVASNIRQMGRVQLLVEVLQRVHRMMNETDQKRLAEAFSPYLKGHAGQKVISKLYEALSATSLQSPDDLEATYREKAGKSHQGYVANITETCDPENPLQLVTKVQVASNHIDDSRLLSEALPDLKQRTELETIITDGGHGSPETDVVLETHHVKQLQTAIRGRNPDPNLLHLSDFVIKINNEGKPAKISCAQGQTVAVQTSSQKKAYVANFASEVCQTCPLVDICPAQPGQRDERNHLGFTQAGAHASERRRRSLEYLKVGRNLRASVESSIRSIKHPFPASKLPVRGQFRVSCMMIGSAAVTNVRRIQRYLEIKMRGNEQPNKTLKGSYRKIEQPGISIFIFAKSALEAFSSLLQQSKLGFNW